MRGEGGKRKTPVRQLGREEKWEGRSLALLQLTVQSRKMPGLPPSVKFRALGTGHRFATEKYEKE